MKKGFTLIEILIATAIFMTVMVVAIGIFSTTVASSSTSGQLRVTAQSARYIFESMTREIRAAHGLAQPVAGGNGELKLVIKPFEYDAVGRKLTINQAKKTGVRNGLATYTVTRKIYSWNLTEGAKKIILSVYQSPADLTIDELAVNTTWTRPTGSSDSDFLPKDLALDDFKILNSYSYPDNPDQQTSQAFIQLQLTVVSKSATVASRTGLKPQTTLRSMIVPRDFTSPYEVVQQGVQGGQ